VRQSGHARRETKSGQAHDLVFCNDDGSKLQPGQFHEVLWAAQRKSGLRRIEWHELRHSFASILTLGGALRLLDEEPGAEEAFARAMAQAAALIDPTARRQKR
jgi:site-specific recombinase XerD